MPPKPWRESVGDASTWLQTIRDISLHGDTQHKLEIVCTEFPAPSFTPLLSFTHNQTLQTFGVKLPILIHLVSSLTSGDSSWDKCGLSPPAAMPAACKGSRDSPQQWEQAITQCFLPVQRKTLLIPFLAQHQSRTGFFSFILAENWLESCRS